MTREGPAMPEITEELIRPFITRTYGDNGMTRALIVHLADKIDTYDGYYDERGGREYMVMRVCWDWMTGGTTAESVARQIEEALTTAFQQELSSKGENA